MWRKRLGACSPNPVDFQGILDATSAPAQVIVAVIGAYLKATLSHQDAVRQFADDGFNVVLQPSLGRRESPGWRSMNKPLQYGRPAEILLVEDSEGDVLLMREAFKRTGWRVNLHPVGNGRAGLAFLRKEGDYRAAPSPDLIFLDLILPDLGGREIMAEIAADERLRHLPVVVLSADQQAVGELYRMRCNTFIVKPIDFHQLQRIIQLSCDYWLGAAVLLGLPRN